MKIGDRITYQAAHLKDRSGVVREIDADGIILVAWDRLPAGVKPYTSYVFVGNVDKIETEGGKG